MRVTEIVSEIYPTDFSSWEAEMRAQGFPTHQIRDKSAHLGTKAHKILEFPHEKLKTNDEKLIKVQINIKEFIKKHKYINIFPEKHVYRIDDAYRFDGHPDSIGIMNGEKWIIDLKTYGLFDEHKEKTNEFKKASAENLKKTNLQTFLYANCNYINFPEKLPEWERLDISMARRGCLHVNHLGWEFHEFKRKPSKKIVEKIENLLNITNIC